MRLLDLFCGGGGCSVGYHRAGFTDITGVDNEAQPRYPYRFIKDDALDYLLWHGHEYDAIHASPPCQVHSCTKAFRGNRRAKKINLDLIPETRRLLESVGKPWVIENVPGSRLSGTCLCGEMFGLRVIRHRWFESSFYIPQPEHQEHTRQCWDEFRHRREFGGSGKDARERHYNRGGYYGVFGHDLGPGAFEAMGINWMDASGLSQAIPPAYTEYIGRYLLAQATYGAIA